MVVMTATFIMEIAGPMLVKIGVKKAGEVGLNITEDDLIKTYKVSDVMEAEPDIIPHGMPLGEILETFSKTQSIYYPVVDNESKIVGKITVAGIKEMFANRDVAGWLLACDVAETFSDKTSGSTPLEDAIEHMKKYDIENMSVVADDGTDRLVGVLDRQKTLRKISAEILRRRELADGMSITL
jgi:predicted transcriptional regulator